MTKRAPAAAPPANLLPGHRHPDVRAASTCTECGQTDNHPKHTRYGRLPDGSRGYTDRHLDCCGCPSCVSKLDHAGVDLHGLELAAHLIEHRAHLDAIDPTTDSREV